MSEVGRYEIEDLATKVGLYLDRPLHQEEIVELAWLATIYGYEEVNRVAVYVAHRCLSFSHGMPDVGALVDFWYTLNEKLHDRFLDLVGRNEEGEEPCMTTKD